MPYIKVDVDRINEYQKKVYDARRKVKTISGSFSSIGYCVDSDVKNHSDIRRKIQRINDELSDITTVLQRMNYFLGDTALQYSQIEKVKPGQKYSVGGSQAKVDIKFLAKKIAQRNGLDTSKVADIIVSGEYSMDEVVKYANGLSASGALATKIKTIARIGSRVGASIGTSAPTATVGVVSATISKSSSAVKFTSPFSHLDIKSLISDTIKTGGSIYSAYKAGFFGSGFNIKSVGDYIHIFGQRKPRAAFKAPAGNRVKVGSDAYFSKGYALWYKGATFADRIKSSFSGFGKDTFGIINSAGKLNVGSLIGYAGVAYDTISGLVGNVKNGASVSKIFADATTDAAKGLGSMAVTATGAKIGAAIGSFIPIPGVGTLVGGVIGGAIAGFAYNYIVDGGIQIGGKSIAGWVSTGIEKAGDWLGNQASKVGDAISSGAKKAGQAISDGAKKVANVVSDGAKKIGNSISNGAKKVGDAISSGAKTAKKKVKNFFKKLF